MSFQTKTFTKEKQRPVHQHCEISNTKDKEKILQDYIKEKKYQITYIGSVISKNKNVLKNLGEGYTL